MDFNYVFFSGHFTCGCTLYKKMRHFCDIGLHNCNFLLDYNDLTLQPVLSGLHCNKFASRLLKFFIVFYRLKYICHQNTPKLYLLFLLWAYHPKTCITSASKICQFFRFGLHPYKLATMRARSYRAHYYLVLSCKT